MTRAARAPCPIVAAASAPAPAPLAPVDPMTVTLPDDLAALRARAAADPDVPPFVRRLLDEGARLEHIRLDAYGRWWHEGQPIDHPRVRTLFDRSLHRTAAGTWVLIVPPYTYPVLVDDVGRFVTQLRDTDSGWQLELSTGEAEPLDASTWRTDGDAWLGVRLQCGDEARLVGAAHQKALAAVDIDDDGWFVALDGPDGDVARIAMRDAARPGRES